jgi:hypothetical protein
VAAIFILPFCELTKACFHPNHFLQVFSDEFEQEGRTFHDGNDPRWTAINKNDCKRMAQCTGRISLL